VPLPTASTLLERIRNAHDQLEPYRAKRIQAMAALRGQHHPDGDGAKRYLNLIRRTYNTLAYNIVAGNPLNRVESRLPDYEVEAALLTMLLDHQAKVMNRVKTTRAIVMDAFFGPAGIRRVGIRRGPEVVTLDNRTINVGQLYEARVQFDDYFCDPEARNQEELRYEGERRWVTRRSLVAAGMDEDDAMSLPAREEDPDYEGKKTGSVGTYEDPMDRRVGVYECFYYDSGRIRRCVLPAQETRSAARYLLESEWEGPETGPFRKLVFQPDNDFVLGSPPANDWLEIAEAHRIVTNRMIRDIEKGKLIYGVGQDTPEDEIEALEQSEHKQFVRMSNTANIAPIDLTATNPNFGPAQSLLAQWASVAGGNTDILAGTSTGTERATIFSGLQANAGAMVEAMREVMYEHEAEVSRDLAWYAMTDPLMQVPLSYDLPAGQKIEVNFDSAALTGKHADFYFNITPKSMGRLDPQVRLNNTIQLLNFIVGAAQASAMTGGMIDVQGVARLGGRLMDMDEIAHVVRDAAILQTNQLASMRAGPVPRGQLNLAPRPGTYARDPNARVPVGMPDM
jgi:hypothetical protein